MAAASAASVGAAVLLRRRHIVSPADLSGGLLLELYLVLLAALWTSFGGWRGLRDRLGFRFTSLTDMVLALGVWIGALLVGGALTEALTPWLGQPESNVAPLLDLAHDPFFVLVVVPTTAVLAPAAEELYFRGALFGWLRGRLRAPLAAVIASAIFAAAHLSPTLLPLLFSLGLGATLIYHRTGSTLNSFVLHASQNTFAVVAYYVLLRH